MDVGMGYSVITPDVVIRPILLLADPSVNHSAPSGPAVMPDGPPPGMGYSMITPEVVIRPILLTEDSVNHSAPSGPAVMPKGPLAERRDGVFGDHPGGGDPSDLGWRNSSVNHSAPSGPAVMPPGKALDRWDGVLGDHPGRGDPSDFVGKRFSEPQCAIRSCCDAIEVQALRTV